jgi:hypothetical protein
VSKHTYKKNGKQLLEGYTDSDWGTLVNNKRESRTGYVLCFAGAAINWISKKQGCTALSSTEAEYIALCTAAQNKTHIRTLLMELQQRNLPVTLIHIDNQGAKAIAESPINKQRSKHIDIKYHFTREKISNGTIHTHRPKCC